MVMHAIHARARRGVWRVICVDWHSLHTYVTHMTRDDASTGSLYYMLRQSIFSVHHVNITHIGCAHVLTLPHNMLCGGKLAQWFSACTVAQCLQFGPHI